MYKNNWFEWSYNGVSYASKDTPTSPIEIKINNLPLAVDSHYQELLNNAAYIKDHFQEPLDLFFSGGINSQVILRTYLDLGIPINVYIARYENKYNIHDVFTAVKICEELNVKHTIIDFNLEHFFENDADRYFQQCYCLDVKNLINLKLVEYSDNIPIIGNRYPYIYRNSMFYSEEGKWLLKMTEDEITVQAAILNSRPAVVDWFFHSPEVSMSLLQTDIVKNLTLDKIPGRATFLFEKNDLYKQYWSTFAERTKRSGFYHGGELMDNNNSLLYPSFMIDFSSKKIGGNVKHSTPKVFDLTDLQI